VHSSRVFDQATSIKRRKLPVEFPDRPLNRISSTFFRHLSSDYHLIPIATLKDVAGILRAKNLKAGLNEGDEVIYKPKLDNKFASKPCALFVHSLMVLSYKLSAGYHNSGM
jgi:hypothetical protein